MSCYRQAQARNLAALGGTGRGRCGLTGYILKMSDGTDGSGGTGEARAIAPCGPAARYYVYPVPFCSDNNSLVASATS